MPNVPSLPNGTTSHFLSTHRDIPRQRALWGWETAQPKLESPHSCEKPSIPHEPSLCRTGKEGGEGQKGGNWTARSSWLYSLLRMCPLKSHPTLSLALLSLPQGGRHRHRSYSPSAAAKCVLNKGRLKPSGILEATLQQLLGSS